MNFPEFLEYMRVTLNKAKESERLRIDLEKMTKERDAHVFENTK